MRIMTAGMHDTRVPGAIRDVVLFLNGKRIDISAYRYDRRIRLSGRDNLGDKSAFTRSYLVRNTACLQLPTKIGCRRKFLAAEFGALMYVAPNLGELRAIRASSASTRFIRGLEAASAFFAGIGVELKEKGG